MCWILGKFCLHSDFRGRLHGSEKHVTLKLTKSQCSCWITQRVWAEHSRDLVGMAQLNKGSCSHGSASPELLEAKLQGAQQIISYIVTVGMVHLFTQWTAFQWFPNYKSVPSFPVD